MSYNNENKKIASNTFFLYIRMFLTMGITLYTSRIILQVLGIENFGIYNVVAGFVSLLAFFQSSLVNATQRYLNISLGKNDIHEANVVFSQSFILYVLFAILLFIFCEIFGIWFINNKLQIGEDRIFAANVVLQTSLLNAIIQILQVVYTANIIARERMQAYAYVSVVEVCLKLALVLILLYVSHYDSLIVYSIMMSLSSLIILLIYKGYCNIYFTESRIRFIWDRQQLRTLLSFISQNLYGCISWMLGSQGVNILLNIFFGPSINAARAISTQVYGAIFRFTDNIMAAIRPQIVKSYAKNEIKRMINLIGTGTKLSYTLFLLLAIPVYFNIDMILSLWLTEVPEKTNVFIQLMLIDSIINSLSIPLVMISMSTGIIKRSQVFGKSFILMVLPISYLAYKLNIWVIPELVLYFTILADICYLFYMLYDAYKQIKLDCWIYLKQIILPLLVTTLICGVITYCSILFFDMNGWKIFIISLLTSTISIMFCSYNIVLSHDEKVFLKQIINRKMGI